MNWNDIEFTGSQTGHKRTTCPSCSHNRKKTKDKCLSIDFNKGVAFCHNCNDTAHKEERKRKEYTPPPQDWKNYTNLSDGAVKWFKGRGISQSTLIDLKITEEQIFQPSQGKEMNCVVFNYFEGQELVNKKYRSASKDFTQSKNAKKIFYGINDIIGHDEVVMVEGEMDKLSFWEAGVKNCISVPNGANDVNDVIESCGNYLKSLDVIYIATDNDEKGNALERDLVRRFGKYRCKRVSFPAGCKDANDVLVKETTIGLTQCLEQAKEYPLDGVHTLESLQDDLWSYYDNGLESGIKIQHPDIAAINNQFTFITGQLTTVTGIPTHGKSTFVEFYLMRLLIENPDMAIGFYSPEHDMLYHHGRFAQKVIGKPFLGTNKMNEAELQKYMEWAVDRIYLTMPDENTEPNWDWVMEKMRELIYRYGIKVFVVDAFNKVQMGKTDTNEINQVLSKLTLFKNIHDIHIILVAHPTKMRKKEGSDDYMMPKMYDISGSGNFYNQTDNGACVYRYFGENYTIFETQKIKYEHIGKLDTSTWQYHKPSGRYYHFKEDATNWLDTTEQTNLVLPNEEFETGLPW